MAVLRGVANLPTERPNFNSERINGIARDIQTEHCSLTVVEVEFVRAPSRPEYPRIVYKTLRIVIVPSNIIIGTPS